MVKSWNTCFRITEPCPVKFRAKDNKMPASYTVRGIQNDHYVALRNKAADETKAEGKNDSINKQILEAIRQYLKPSTDK